MREPIVCKGLVEEGHRAGVGDGDANHHADAGGFARAVGAEEAEHAAGFNLETEVCYGDLGVVNLRTCCSSTMEMGSRVVRLR
jgi:hypothetical protein